MTDPLQLIFQPGSLKTYLYPPNSRYYGLDTATLTTADGRAIVYLRRRFVPPAERFALIQEHIVAQGERLDHIAARYFGDPELFWRLCDANAAMRPEELTESVSHEGFEGRTLRITLPEGIPGATNV